MIEITDAAAEKLLASQVEGKVVKLFKTSNPGDLPRFALGLGPFNDKDLVFESNDVQVYMNPSEVRRSSGSPSSTTSTTTRGRRLRRHQGSE